MTHLTVLVNPQVLEDDDVKFRKETSLNWKLPFEERVQQQNAPQQSDDTLTRKYQQMSVEERNQIEQNGKALVQMLDEEERQQKEKRRAEIARRN